MNDKISKDLQSTYVVKNELDINTLEQVSGGAIYLEHVAIKGNVTGSTRTTTTSYFETR